MVESSEERLRRIIAEDAGMSPGMKARMLDLLGEVVSEIATAPLINEDVLLQAQALNRTAQDLTQRLYSKQISADVYHSQMMILVDSAPRNVLQVASKISQLVIAEWRLSSDTDTH